MGRSRAIALNTKAYPIPGGIIRRIRRNIAAKNLDEERCGAQFVMEPAEWGLNREGIPGRSKWVLIKQFVGAAMVADRMRTLKTISEISSIMVDTVCDRLAASSWFAPQ
jgi:hypothetical protein